MCLLRKDSDCDMITKCSVRKADDVGRKVRVRVQEGAGSQGLWDQDDCPRSDIARDTGARSMWSSVSGQRSMTIKANEEPPIVF